jgi:hypothetical protein
MMQATRGASASVAFGLEAATRAGGGFQDVRLTIIPIAVLRARALK